MLVELYDSLNSTCFTRDVKRVLCRSSNQLDLFGVLPVGLTVLRLCSGLSRYPIDPTLPGPATPDAGIHGGAGTSIRSGSP